MDLKQMLAHLRGANEVAKRALSLGRHPFGAILVAPDGETVLMEQVNAGSVNHAEATLARQAAVNYSPEYLWNCTLVTTAEPCVMCSGTMYWANIGTLVYGMSETRLLELTGNHAENPTFNLDSRTVFKAGQKPVQVFGPFVEVEAEIAALHKNFWKELK